MSLVAKTTVFATKKETTAKSSARVRAIAEIALAAAIVKDSATPIVSYFQKTPSNKF